MRSRTFPVWAACSSKYLLTADDQPAVAARNAPKATIDATDVQRTANVIRLHNCAAAADPELRAKIEPFITIYRHPRRRREEQDGEATS